MVFRIYFSNANDGNKRQKKNIQSKKNLHAKLYLKQLSVFIDIFINLYSPGLPLKNTVFIIILKHLILYVFVIFHK